jgi:four helix bundle protein
MYKFENLEVWKLALEYMETCYRLAEGLPLQEEHNLKSQIRRAATSAALNIAEGSTGQTDREQPRFLGLGLRSLVETVACERIIVRRGYAVDGTLLQDIHAQGELLAKKLQAMRKAIAPPQGVRLGRTGLNMIRWSRLPLGRWESEGPLRRRALPCFRSTAVVRGPWSIVRRPVLLVAAWETA